MLDQSDEDSGGMGFGEDEGKERERAKNLDAMTMDGSD
jgi:hypothetical protein